MRRTDLVFFLSGAAALVEETVWARWLARILGSDAAGAAIVVAVFLLGLGLGAILFARIAERARSPLRLYVGLELAIAAWAAATPFVLANVPPIESFGGRAAFAVLDGAAGWFSYAWAVTTWPPPLPCWPPVSSSWHWGVDAAIDVAYAPVAHEGAKLRRS